MFKKGKNILKKQRAKWSADMASNFVSCNDQKPEKNIQCLRVGLIPNQLMADLCLNCNI